MRLQLEQKLLIRTRWRLNSRRWSNISRRRVKRQLHRYNFSRPGNIPGPYLIGGQYDSIIKETGRN